MKIQNTFINGLYLFHLKPFLDLRGGFIKIFNKDFFKEFGIDMSICEVYISVSNKDVVRGMHFQTPPYEHNKIVFVQEGFIKDVVLDLRKTSPTYGKCFSIELNENSNIALFIPKGLAHGFASLENNSRILYIQDSVYSYEYDCGVLYDSFNFDWGIGNPILSDRDKGFEKFLEYKTPF